MSQNSTALETLKPNLYGQHKAQEGFNTSTGAYVKARNGQEMFNWIMRQNIDKVETMVCDFCPKEFLSVYDGFFMNNHEQKKYYAHILLKAGFQIKDYHARQ